MIIKKDDALGLAEGLESLLEDPAFDPGALDCATRRRLSEAARKLSLVTEAPGDTVHRIAHTVRYKMNFIPCVILSIQKRDYETPVFADPTYTCSSSLSNCPSR